MALIIPGANITAQWYGDTFPGTKMATWEKFLLHSTETNSWPGYGGGASMPNATYHPRLRALRQHCSADRSARALRNPSSTPVSENRDNVLQVEIVAYSDYRLAAERGGLWIGDLTDAHMEDLARIHVWMHKLEGTPLRTDVRWAPGAKTSAGTAGKRLSGSQYDAARGVLAHFHASGNTHWDVGGFDIDRYMRAVARVSGATPTPPPEDDLPTPADVWNHDIPDIILNKPLDAWEQLRAARADANKAMEATKRLEAQVAEILALLKTPPA